MLDTQLLDIPLSGGLEELADKRLVPVGAWLSLKNCRRSKQAGFVKRFGTTALSRAILGGGTISSCVALGALDSTLFAIDNANIYTYSSAASQWINRTSTLDTTGAALNIRPYPATIVHQTLYGIANRIVTFSQCRSSDGLIHCAYELVVPGAATNAIYDLTIDEATQAIVRGPQLIDATGFGPRVLFCNNTVVVVYADNGVNIKARSKPTTTSAYGAAIILVTNHYVGVDKRVFDAQAHGANFVLLYEDNVNANPVNVNIYNSTLALQNSSRWSTATFGTHCHALSCMSAGNEGIWTAASTQTGGANIALYATRCNATTAAQQFAPVNTVAGTYPVAAYGSMKRLTIGRTDSTHASVMASFGEDFPVVPLILRTTLDSTGGIQTEVPAYGYQLASRSFIAADSRQYCFISDVTYSDPTTTPKSLLLRSLYLLDTEALFLEQGAGRIVGRGPMRQIDAGVNNFMMSRVLCDAVISTSSNGAYIMVPTLRQLNTTLYPVEFVTATWNDPKRHRIVQQGASAMVQPCQVFDRNKLIEQGFHRLTDQPQVTDGGAGALSAGLYSYVTVQRHINTNGEIVRSAPSVAGTITLAASHQAAINITYGTYTDRQPRDTTPGTSQPEAPIMELYRTQANGTTFNLVGEQLMPTSGSGSLVANFVDNMADTVAATKPILYTQSPIGPIANLAPPNLRCIVTWRGRLCGLGPDSRTLWISSEYVVGSQPTWHDNYNCYLPDTFTALGVVDDKLIAFTDATAYHIDGVPADFLGNGNTLTPVSISADIGCIDERGVVQADGGVVFASRRSFGLVGRNLQVEEIGASVIDTISTNPVVKSCVYLDRDREARFCMAPSEGSNTGVVLVWDTGNKVWSTDEYYNSVAVQTAANVVASAIVNGIWYGAFANGLVIKEDQTRWDDQGVYVGMTLGTPWIKTGAIGGFQRVKRILIQGEGTTPHDLQVQIYRNFVDTVDQTTFFTNAEIQNQANYPIEQFICRVQNQKSPAMRVVIQDLNPSDAPVGTGQGIRYFGITFRLGIKKADVGKSVGAVNKA